MKILVTGGAGFIGSALIRKLLLNPAVQVLCIDKLTYAANPEVIDEFNTSKNFDFHQNDICDLQKINTIVNDFKPHAMICLASETHVDRSIDDPLVFLSSNVLGTGVLLHVATKYFLSLPESERKDFRFLQVSTDEVYGDLKDGEGFFLETDRFEPSSPYSASKASADHLVSAWHRTFGLPTLITHCSNNFGIYQHPEKLIPIVTCKALSRQSIPVYGDGKQVRDWIHVDDHVDGLLAVLEKGLSGETYNIGASNEISNIEIVVKICSILDAEFPHLSPSDGGFASFIRFVTDRPGHDRRYAIDCAKLEKHTGWRAKNNFVSCLEDTVKWYSKLYFEGKVRDDDALVRRGNISQ